MTVTKLQEVPKGTHAGRMLEQELKTVERSQLTRRCEEQCGNVNTTRDIQHKERF